jgi:hypothetical protein
MRQFVPLGLPHRRSIDGSLPGELLLIFLNDRNQDQEKGEEANKIEEWAAFVWIIRESQRSAVYTFNQEKAKKRKSGRRYLSKSEGRTIPLSMKPSI